MLRRGADARLEVVASGEHAAAFRRTTEALEPPPGAEALVLYAGTLAEQMDNKPSVALGREYRLALGTLLELCALDGEAAEELAAREAFYALLATPTRPQVRYD